MKKLISIACCLVLAVVLIARAGPTVTSGKTAQQIISNARVYYSESGTSWADNAAFLTWLNDGVMDIAVKSQCLETSETISLTASTVEYTPTVSPVVVKAVIYNDEDGKKTGLQRTTLQGIRGQFTGNRPEYYYFFAGKIGIYPTSPVVTAATVTAYSAYQPSVLAISDTIPLPAVYDKALTLYIVAQALIKDRDFNSAQTVMQQYNNELDFYMSNLSKKEDPNPTR